MINKQKLIWIDTDCGIDDSTAILICLNSPTVKVLGISCIGGNVSLANVTNNVLRTLKVYGKGCENIPVYNGCQKALLTESMHVPHIHGNDGLGDIDSSAFGVEETVPAKTENGIFKMIETIKNNEHISVLTLGPLTNFALALHIAPDIVEHIDSLVIMGGAEDMKGNTTKFAEFNIRCDPEAAQMVFKEFPLNKIILSTWTLTLHSGIVGDDFDQVFNQTQTVMENWIGQTWRKALKYDNHVALMADPLAAFIICYEEKAILESVNMKIEVPLYGDEVGATKCTEDQNGARVVTKIDYRFFVDTLKNLLKSH